MITTIPKNHTRKIAAIREQVTTAKSYSLSNDFAAVDIEPAAAWDQLYRYDFAKLTDRGEGRWTISVHGNLWYELRAA